MANRGKLIALAIAQYSPNNIVNPTTGFIENPAYPSDFDSERKRLFIELTRQGVGLYTICKKLSLSHHTAFKHIREDKEFNEALETAKREYGCFLETTSKQVALEPKNYVERIFQLKSIFPDKYADNKNPGPLTINVTINSAPTLPDGKSTAIDGEKVINAEIVGNQKL